MHSRTCSAVVLACVLACLPAFAVGAQEAKSIAPAVPSADMQAQMAKAKELGAPGANHAVLKSIEGTWMVTSRMWMKPGDAPQESAGTSMMVWILGGRFLQQQFKSNWMGQSFEGIGYIGYDNVKKAYVSVWMDSMSTGIFQSTGQYDAVTKTLRDAGTFSCPMTGEKERPFRAEWRFVDNDHHIYSMFMKDSAGKEFKSMELHYTRVK